MREAQTLTTNAVASRNVEFPDPSGDIIVPGIKGFLINLHVIIKI